MGNGVPQSSDDNTCWDLTKSNISGREYDLHHKLTGNYRKDFKMVQEFMLKRGNPYLADGCKPLHNCVSGVIVDDDVARRILNFNRDAEDRYIAFRNERYIDKYKKLSDTIIKVKMPDFAQTSKTGSSASAESSSQVSIKEISYLQKFEIARSRGIPITEILEHDLLSKSSLFENQFTAKPDKHILIKELEKAIVPSDYYFSKSSNLPTNPVIDFMSVARRLSVSKKLCN